MCLSWGSILSFVVEVLLLLLNYFHVTPVEQWKYNMCDVPLLAMSGRGLATLVSAEVVMTGTQ